MMKNTQAPKPVFLFCGLILSEISLLEPVRKVLKENFGEISSEAEPIDFSFTEYYRGEMGEGLKRCFVAFQDFISPEALASIKVRTDQIETDFSEDRKRRVNIDPGYLDLARVVLASTKDYAHRIYLRDGIFAEVTLQWRKKKGFIEMPFTYRDYATDYAKTFFEGLREKYQSNELLAAP